jgi:hypothetical protein
VAPAGRELVSKTRLVVNSPKGSTPSHSSIVRYAHVMPTAVERSWVAGMLDADGCITLNLQGNGQTVFRKPMVVVDNTDHEILDELMRNYGGSLVKKKKYKKHHRQAWSWRLYGANVIIKFLQEIVPFMHCKMKKSRAMLILTKYKLITRPGGNYSPAERRSKIAFEKKFMSIGAGRGSQAKPIH